MQHAVRNKMTTINKKQKHWLTQTQMSDYLCVARQTLFRWGVKPVSKIGSHSYFTIQDVIDNRVENALKGSKDVAGGVPETDTFEYERYRLTKLQADAQELKNKINQQEVAPIDFIAFVLSGVAAEMAGIIDSLPLNLIRRHPELTTIQQENIKRELSKAMAALSRLDEKIPELMDDYEQKSR